MPEEINFSLIKSFLIRVRCVGKLESAKIQYAVHSYRYLRITVPDVLKQGWWSVADVTLNHILINISKSPETSSAGSHTMVPR